MKRFKKRININRHLVQGRRSEVKTDRSKYEPGLSEDIRVISSGESNPDGG